VHRLPAVPEGTGREVALPAHPNRPIPASA
jgi:hypothetical protein